MLENNMMNKGNTLTIEEMLVLIEDLDMTWAEFLEAKGRPSGMEVGGKLVWSGTSMHMWMDFMLNQRDKPVSNMRLEPFTNTFERRYLNSIVTIPSNHQQGRPFAITGEVIAVKAHFDIDRDTSIGGAIELHVQGPKLVYKYIISPRGHF